MRHFLTRSDDLQNMCCMYMFNPISFLETDKQLVELIHVGALDVLRGRQQSSFRYQSVTLFLRGKSLVTLLLSEQCIHLFTEVFTPLNLSTFHSVVATENVFSFIL